METIYTSTKCILYLRVNSSCDFRMKVHHPESLSEIKGFWVSDGIYVLKKGSLSFNNLVADCLMI